MALKSMTGFARDDGSIGRYNWFWEVRTVNGRGRDIRFRLPPGYENLEESSRALLNKYIVRGNCNLTLRVERITGDQEIRLNEAALTQIARAIRRTEMVIDAGEPTIDGILGLRGVLEVSEPEHSKEELDEFTAAVLKSLESAVQKIVAARRSEGEHMQAALSSHLDQIEQLTNQIETSETRSPEVIKQRLQDQIRKLLDNDSGFNEERLHQEAVLLATKADVEEELIRLKAHIVSARELMEQDEAVGRKLDFLTQEFNREANTICSKANAIDITKAGLELKAVIDQLKEQVQNIE
jgi:uncharacterized protein (TIGR00255 family)